MKRTILLALLSALLAGTAVAQDIRKYEGEMKLPPDLYLLKDFNPRSNKIIGSYSYYENADEDRIRHGDFMLTFVTPTFNRELKGRYADGKKTGTWTVRDVHTKNVTGYTRHMEATFSFADDFLDGPFNGSF